MDDAARIAVSAVGSARRPDEDGRFVLLDAGTAACAPRHHHQPCRGAQALRPGARISSGGAEAVETASATSRHRVLLLLRTRGRQKIFNIPGLGRLALDAAIAQDLPPLQTATLALILLGIAAGLLIQTLRRALLGPALRERALPTLHAPTLARGRSTRWAAVACAVALLILIIAGLLRDPLHGDTAARLLPPGHLLASVSFGAGPGYLLRRHLLPAVLPPILRNALLRLPTTVLVLASLGFLGLGEQPPTAEWGRLLSENQPYVELAPLDRPRPGLRTRPAVRSRRIRYGLGTELASTGGRPMRIMLPC
jgi:hypothetical protein